MLEASCLPTEMGSPASPLKLPHYELYRRPVHRSIRSKQHREMGSGGRRNHGARTGTRTASVPNVASANVFDDSGPAVPNEEIKEWWDTMTQELVQVSTIPFMVLLLPQVIRNTVNMASGNLAALSILSWMGFMTALLGNTILLSYFVTKGERGAALVQAIGVASNFVMLGQIYLAGFMSALVFWLTAGFTAVSCFVNSAYVTGALDAGAWHYGQLIWGVWETFLGVLGIAVLVQVLWSTFGPFQSLVPGLVTGTAALTVGILDRYGFLSNRLKGLWGGLSAWTATLLFAFQPVGQLVRNFTDPSSLEGLSLGTILLAKTGNGLMVPRALHTRDKIWLTGTLWGSLMMGWAQLLSMFLGRSEAGTGNSAGKGSIGVFNGCKLGIVKVRYLHPGMFFLFTGIALVYFLFVFTMDACSFGLRAHVVSGKRRKRLGTGE